MTTSNWLKPSCISVILGIAPISSIGAPIAWGQSRTKSGNEMNKSTATKEKEDIFSQQRRYANEEDSLERIVPFSSIIDDGIVCTKNGDYVRTWRVEGMSFEGLSEEEVYSRMEALNLFIRGLATGKYAFWVHRIRRYASDKLEVPEYNDFTQDLMERYYEKLADQGMMSSEFYLTVVYRPFPLGRGGVFGKLHRTVDEIKNEIEAAAERVEIVSKTVMSSLATYRPQQLGNYVFAGRTFSSQLEFYSYLINGFWWRIPVKNLPLYKYLPVSRLLFGNEIIEYRDTFGSEYGAFLELKDYSDYTTPGVLNTLLALDCEYIETHSFSPMTTLDAQSALKKQRNQMISSEDNALSQIVEIDEAIDSVISGNFVLGEYHYSLLVKGETPDQTREFRSNASQLLNNANFLGVDLEKVTASAYAAQLPCNWKSRPREARISSRNFTGVCSFHTFDSGKRNGNPWGEAVTLFRTPAGAPFYFNFHDTPLGVDSTGNKALGNCQIIGQSGGGKTVLALFLMLNLLKYGTQCVFFDKDRGAEIAIRRVGGKYLALENGKPTGFAPFKMEPTEKNILFWVALVKYCTLRTDVAHTPEEENLIASAVRSVAGMPIQQRCIDAVLQFLPVGDPNGLAQRLKKWSISRGNLGWALDCQRDELQFEEGRPYGFDYTDYLDNEEICGPIMMYLMYRVEEQIDGRLFAFFMDEYWKALSVDYFKDFAKNKQKTIRKQNGLGVYMTQSPHDTLQSDIARTLIEQTATFIFLPNPAADHDDYVNGFKLTETEFKLVRELQDSSRMFLIKQGHRVSLARLDLGDFKNEIKILSGSTDEVERLDRLRQKYGDDPAQWAQPFLDGES